MLKKKLISVACLSAGLGLGAASASALPYLQPNDGNPFDDNYVQLLEDGWDCGARSIHARLARQGVPDLPSPRTVHRILVRAGVIEAEPAKRPRSSFRRFEHAQPNGCWQIDGTGWHLASGALVCILRVIDDHSRMILASVACAGELAASRTVDGSVALPASLVQGASSTGDGAGATVIFALPCGVP